jgi:glucose dehydrogenase
MGRRTRNISSLLLGMGAIALSGAAASQTGTSVYDGDWPDYHGNPEAQRYSALDQINADNVADLAVLYRQLRTHSRF